MIQRFHLDTVIRFLRFLLRVPRWMGENPFLGFLTLLFVALLISSMVFYRYVLAVSGTSEIIQIRFDQRAFQQVIQEWQERKEKVNEAGVIRARNIFIPSYKSPDLTEE